MGKTLRMLGLGLALGLISLLTIAGADASRDNRRVLCIGILHNAANTANQDPNVLRLCGEVGVYP